ncbi:hypothetical protein BDK51DRAFT_39408 [Blyttiomyces helicus]|uniref:Uncharacterized protein n=1 Tax=Blyttiomyces helicus TaxID=388810 RepID=A0A4P9WA12_9FUNG|nr:hypothetical protein BDK51DRAFT_39408 [Blyttiomyces helicus]|eukprot:RKO88333.1 hypothetical protein BDK51DRAFT_39408 [Blyttiomyces helicus]
MGPNSRYRFTTFLHHLSPQGEDVTAWHLPLKKRAGRIRTAPSRPLVDFPLFSRLTSLPNAGTAGVRPVGAVAHVRRRALSAGPQVGMFRGGQREWRMVPTAQLRRWHGTSLCPCCRPYLTRMVVRLASDIGGSRRPMLAEEMPPISSQTPGGRDFVFEPIFVCEWEEAFDAKISQRAMRRCASWTSTRLLLFQRALSPWTDRQDVWSGTRNHRVEVGGTPGITISHCARLPAFHYGLASPDSPLKAHLPKA